MHRNLTGMYIWKIFQIESYFQAFSTPRKWPETLTWHFFFGFVHFFRSGFTITAETNPTREKLKFRTWHLVAFEWHCFPSNTILVNDHNLHAITLNHIQCFVKIYSLEKTTGFIHMNNIKVYNLYASGLDYQLSFINTREEVQILQYKCHAQQPRQKCPWSDPRPRSQ